MLQAVSYHLVFTLCLCLLAASSALLPADTSCGPSFLDLLMLEAQPSQRACFSSFSLCVFSVKTKWALLLVSSKNDVFTVCAGKQSDAG